MVHSSCKHLGPACIHCANGLRFVALPRHFWRLANPGKQLTTLYRAAVTLDEARLSAQLELQDIIMEAKQEIALRRLQIWDTDLERAFATLQVSVENCEQIQLEITRGASTSRGTQQACGVPPSDVDSGRIQSMAQVHRSLKQAAQEARSASCRWDDLVRRCLLLEDLAGKMYPSAVELATSWQSTFGRMMFRSSSVRTGWHCLVLFWFRTLRPRVLRLMAGFCGILSVSIVLGQLTMFSDEWSLSLLSLLFHRDHGFGLTQLFCILPLSYMLCTSYWSVFRLKATGWYRLYPNRGTDTISLLWCGSILARLAAPLCYHFLLLIRVKGTAFQATMEQMNAVPAVGRSFTLFPILIFFLCMCNIQNVYSRLVQVLSLDGLDFEFDWANLDDNADVRAEGKRLIQRERVRCAEERQLLELHDRRDDNTAIPLRLQIAQLIEDGTLPHDWNAHSPGP